MKKLLQVSLLASAVMVGLSGCNDEKASAPTPKVEGFEAESAYAIGLSMGRYISTTLEKQQELGVVLDNDIILKGVRDGFTDNGEMDDEAIQAALTKYDQHVNKLIGEQAEEQAAEAIAGSEKLLEDNAKIDSVIVTDSGLQYQVLTEGTGPKPTADDMVTVHYTGTLFDGTVFDSSVERDQPATFPLNQVIPGWTEGVQLMSVGSKYKFVIPSELAYGDTGTNIIPGHSVLTFEVELLGIESDEPAADQDEAETNVATTTDEATTEDADKAE